MVLAESAGEGDGSAEGGRPGPVGLPGLHRAHPDTHLRSLAPFHPMQGVERCSSKNMQFPTKAGVLAGWVLSCMGAWVGACVEYTGHVRAVRSVSRVC